MQKMQPLYRYLNDPMSNITSAVRALQSNSSPAPTPKPKKGQLAAAIDAIAETAAQAQQEAINQQAQVVAGNTRLKIEINKQELQKYIRDERRAQGLTQRQLARKCGMSQGTITRAERNGWISFWCLMKIAGGLGRKVMIQ